MDKKRISANPVELHIAVSTLGLSFCGFKQTAVLKKMLYNGSHAQTKCQTFTGVIVICRLSVLLLLLLLFVIVMFLALCTSAIFIYGADRVKTAIIH